VELKSGKAPRDGPHKAQLAVYCLLIEDQFQTIVTEGIIEFSASSIMVPFNSQMRAWILALIEEVQEAKLQGAKPQRSHNQPGRCRGCGFRESCREALR
jgi:CRISPR-associated exonuclease Cas4